MWIDGDTHIFPREVFDRLPESNKVLRVESDGKIGEVIVNPFGYRTIYQPAWYSMKIRLDSMRDAGFDKQVVLGNQAQVPQQYGKLEDSVVLCRAYNDVVADLGKTYEELLVAAEVPHQDPHEAVVELERAVKDLGMKAVRIHGTWCGKNLSSQEYLPFFDKVDELDIPIFIHDHVNIGSGLTNPYNIAKERMDPLMLNFPVGFMFQAATNVADLIYSGILEGHPNLRVVINESGALWVPGLMARLDHYFVMVNQGLESPGGLYRNLRYNIKRFPTEQMKKHFIFCMDTEGDFKGLSFLVNTMKMENNLAIQSDFPHSEGNNDELRWTMENQEISQEDKEKIAGGNIARAFHLN